MAIKIDKKIVAYSVVRGDDSLPAPTGEPTATVQQMHESLARPEMLSGATYKVKTPSLIMRFISPSTTSSSITAPNTKYDGHSKSSSIPRRWNTSSGLSL
jgi:hypothetical protein